MGQGTNEMLIRLILFANIGLYSMLAIWAAKEYMTFQKVAPDEVIFT